MRSKLFPLLLYLFILTSTRAFAQWTWLNPKPSGLTGKSITFTDESNGFILNGSDLLRTRNAGATWEVQQSISTGNEISFNGHLGYIVGNYGTAYKSTDRGETWQKLATGTTENLSSIHILHTDTIYATSDKSLLKSVDGGHSWSKSEIKPDLSNYYVGSLTINKSAFTNSKVGHLACNNGYILKTTDGGETWYVTESTNTIPSNFFTIYFVNSKVGFASKEHHSILRTVDGGETWSALSFSDHAIYSFYFLNENIGFIAGEYGVLYKTTNGGGTWQQIWFQNGLYDATTMHGIHFTDENNGYATGQRGRIIKTIDSGKSWTEYSFTYNDIRDISFPSNDTGYALGSYLYKTTDKGESWQTLTTGLDENTYYYARAQFLSADTGYVITKNGQYSNGVLIKTSDGGASWAQLHIATDMGGISSIYFINNRIGFASRTDFGYIGGLYKTVDGGLTWMWISGFGATKMHFMNTEQGVALRTGDLYRTTDGGESWEKVYEVYGDFTDIGFVNEKVGYISAEYNTVLKTTDRGATWKELKTEYDHLQAIAFYNENVGYVTGEYGKSFQTSDGGLTWQSINMPSLISKLYITKDKTIFATGAFGRLLRSTIEYDECILKALPVTELKADRATLEGIIASNGEEITNIRIEFGTAGRFDRSISVTPAKVVPNTSSNIQLPVQDLQPATAYVVRIRATYKGSERVSDPVEFTTLPAFELSLGYISNITTNSAELFWRVVSNEDEINGIQFEYGTDETFGQHLNATPSTVTKHNSESVSATLQQLGPATKYFVRLKINYKGTEYYSTTNSFITRPEYIINMARPYITETNGTLSASVTTYKGDLTNVVFEYGKSRVYGSKAAATPYVVQESYRRNVQATLTDLNPDSVYFFRLKAKQGDKEIFSGEHMFRASGGVLLEPDKAEQITDTEATLSGLIAPQGGMITNIQIEYGETEAYGKVVNATPNYLYSGSTSTVQAEVQNLFASTKYYFRIKGVVDGETVYSTGRQFMTAQPTGIPEEIDRKLTVYPNPAHDRLFFSHQEVMQRIEVFNQLGKMVQVITPKEQQFSIDISTYTSGVYFVRVHTREHAHIRRIIKL